MSYSQTSTTDVHFHIIILYRSILKSLNTGVVFGSLCIVCDCRHLLHKLVILQLEEEKPKRFLYFKFLLFWQPYCFADICIPSKNTMVKQFHKFSVVLSLREIICWAYTFTIAICWRPPDSSHCLQQASHKPLYPTYLEINYKDDTMWLVMGRMQTLPSRKTCTSAKLLRLVLLPTATWLYIYSQYCVSL